MMMNRSDADGVVLAYRCGSRMNQSDDGMVRVAAATAGHRARYVDLDRGLVADGGVDLGPP